jgi:hypothetical protein
LVTAGVGAAAATRGGAGEGAGGAVGAAAGGGAEWVPSSPTHWLVSCTGSFKRSAETASIDGEEVPVRDGARGFAAFF